MPEISPIDEIKTSITDIGAKLKDAPTKADLSALDTKIEETRKSVNSLIKVGDDKRKEDPFAGYRHVGEFGQEVADLYTPGSSTFGQLPERLKVMSGTSHFNPSGKGFQVPRGFSPTITKGTSTPSGSSTIDFPLPPAFAPGIRETPYTEDDYLDRVQAVPLGDGEQSVELQYADDANRTLGIAGGMFSYWKAEAQQMTTTNPKRRSIRLEPQELYSFAYATDKLLRNSPLAFGSWLQNGMRRSIKFAIGDAIVNGDGAGKPLGILNSPDVISVAKETNQTGVTINEVNLYKMWSRMPAAFRKDAIWLCNQDCEPQFDAMARAAYGVTATINPNLDTIAYNRANGTLKARPIVFSEYCATLGTVGDIILWSPSHYLVAVKTGSNMEMSIHLRFDYAETAFRFIVEVDGRSEYPGVLTPYKGSTTRSAIVTLATRS